MFGRLRHTQRQRAAAVLPGLESGRHGPLAQRDRPGCICRRRRAFRPDFACPDRRSLGLVNPGQGEKYSQGAYHRDLPYQHFVSSRPLGVNALFCLDDFTEENGATLVIPASHKLENLPPDAVIRATEQRVVAPAGSFLLLDAMTYHRGSANLTALARRAVNHVYSIGLVRQQIDLPACLGEHFSADPEVRRLLGYDYPSSGSVAEYYAARRAKLRK